MKRKKNHRFWRLLFMEMATCSTITQNYRKLWFGFTFIQTSRNSTKWNAGGRSETRRLRLLAVVVVGLWRQSRSGGRKSHVLRTARVASNQRVSSHGHKMWLAMKMFKKPWRDYSSKYDQTVFSHLNIQLYSNNCSASVKFLLKCKYWKTECSYRLGDMEGLEPIRLHASLHYHLPLWSMKDTLTSFYYKLIYHLT